MCKQRELKYSSKKSKKHGMEVDLVKEGKKLREREREREKERKGIASKLYIRLTFCTLDSVTLSFPFMLLHLFVLFWLSLCLAFFRLFLYLFLSPVPLAILNAIPINLFCFALLFFSSWLCLLNRLNIFTSFRILNKYTFSFLFFSTIPFEPRFTLKK